MVETKRTLGFVAVALLSAGLAWMFSAEGAIQSKELQSAKLGQEFYPEFKNPNEPTSLTVVAFNEESVEPKAFSVEFVDGKWRIPSHHNYPADGADRLAKTASSAIGIRREELRSSSADDHTELGVIDPLSTDTNKIKGRGQRITLKNGSTVLMDLIVGKQVKSRPGFFYVRHPDEKATYVAKLDLDLSTKFSDWVETDLLKLDRDALRTMIANNYSIDEARGELVKGDIVELKRDKPADPWKLEGIDDKTEELQSAKINDMVATLDDLRLTGVRPKPAGLSRDLKLEQGIRLDQATMLSLTRAGFYPVRGGLLKSNEGEFQAGTDSGVIYNLMFGEIFEGDELEIETGVAEKQDAGADKKADAKKKEEKKSGKASRYLFVMAQFNPELLGPPPVEPKAPGSEPSDEAKEKTPPEAPADPKSEKKKDDKKSSAEEAPEEPKTEKKPADQSGAEEKPAEPQPEKKPEAEPKSSRTKRLTEAGQLATTNAALILLAQDAEAKTAEKAEPKAEEKAEPKAEEKPAAEKTEEKPAAEKPAAEEKEDKPAAEKKEEKPAATEDKPEAPKVVVPEADPKAVEEVKKKAAALEQRIYEESMKKYKADLQAYEEKVEKGKQLADKLNKRFADWYYVIGADSFDKLHVSRKDLVKEKTPVGETPAAPGQPGSPPANPDAPPKAPAPETPAQDTPAPEKSAPKSKEEPEAKEEPETKDAPKKEEPPAEKKPPEEKPEAKDEAAEKKEPAAEKAPAEPLKEEKQEAAKDE